MPEAAEPSLLRRLVVLAGIGQLSLVAASVAIGGRDHAGAAALTRA
jgi:hypothetical protein